MKLLIAMMLAFSVSARAEKTFVYCSEASPSTFNPQMADDGPTFNAAAEMLYNRLVEFEHGGTKIIPALAESWKISKDGREYTFKLRKNVAFHTTEGFKPSRPMNADDVIFSFERPLKKNSPYFKVNGGNYPYFQGMELDKLIASIEKVDDLTVRFKLTKPEAPFLANLAMTFAVVLSKEYADTLLKSGKPEALDLQPVGTGPFVLKRYEKDNVIRYTAFANYWNGRAKLDQVVFAITPDANVRFQKLKAGECQLIAEPAPTDLDAMKTASNVLVMSQPGGNVGYLAMNVAKPPFDKLEVRQALNYALNKQNYISTIFQGTATTAKNPIAPSVWGYNDKIQDYSYNIEKAKELLKQAGYPNGFETELWTLPVSRPYNPNGRKMGELMQADLAKIGVRVKLVTYDWPTYLAKGRKGEHQLIQLGWTTDNGDPDNFLGVLLSCAGIEGGSNMSRWCFQPFDTLISKAKQTANTRERTKLYREAQEIFKKQAPWVPLAHATVFRAMAKNVTGYKISPFGTESFYPVDLK